MLKEIISRRESSKLFDPSWFTHIMEQQQLEVRACRVTPFVSNPGRIVITDRALYFQLFNNIDDVPVSKIEFKTIHRICFRRHALRHIGLEIFFLPKQYALSSDKTSAPIWFLFHFRTCFSSPLDFELSLSPHLSLISSYPKAHQKGTGSKPC